MLYFGYIESEKKGAATVRKNKRIWWILINLFLLAVSLICLWRSQQNVRYINSIQSDWQGTNIEEAVTELHLPSGNTIHLRYSNIGVKVIQSDLCNDRLDCFYTVLTIRNESETDFQQSTTDLYGELRLHQILYRIGYRVDATADADLEYAGDRRWYVRAASKVLGWLGV